MEVALGPDNTDVSLHSNGRSLGVDTEVRILVVTEELVVMADMVVLVRTLVMVDMAVLEVTLVKMAMVVTMQVPSQLSDSICGFTYCFCSKLH